MSEPLKMQRLTVPAEITIDGLDQLAAKMPDGKWRSIRIYFRKDDVAPNGLELLSDPVFTLGDPPPRLRPDGGAENRIMEVIINGKPHGVSTRVTYEDIMRLVLPARLGGPEDWTITYCWHGQGDTIRQGSLRRGQILKVAPGMIFNVVHVQ